MDDGKGKLKDGKRWYYLISDDDEVSRSMRYMTFASIEIVR